MTAFQDIRAALTKRAKITPGFPAQIAVEGNQFAPTSGVAFASLKLQPVSERPGSVGLAGLTFIQGLFLVDLCLPSQKGTGEAESLADQVKSNFRNNPRLAQGDVVVSVEYAERGPCLLDAEWVRVPVTIGWYVWIPTVA